MKMHRSKWSVKRRPDKQSSARRPKAGRTFENLELRALLSTSPWQNPVRAVDVNNDQHVTPADALAIVNDLNTVGVRNLLASTPRAAAGGLALAAAVQSSSVTQNGSFLDVNGDSIVSPADALVVVNALDPDDVVQIRLVVTDLNNNPVTSVNPGDDFKLRAFVRDVRPEVQGQQRGVFAAYLDVTYDDAIAFIDPGAQVTFGPRYQNVQNADIDTEGLVDETGAVVTPIETPSGTAEFLLWEVTASAVDTGTVNFVSDPAEDQSREILVFDFESEGEVPSSRVDFGSVSLEVTDAPRVVIDTQSVTEGNTGNTNVTLTVNLSVESNQTVMVPFTLTDGTATLAGNDFNAQSGTVTFAPDETEQTIVVQVKGDTAIEPDETFFVTLGTPTGGGAVLGNPTGSVTIINDDLPTLSVSDVTVTEGNTSTTTPANFTVTLSQAFFLPVTVVASTAPGTATSTGSTRDFNSTTATLTFAAGETTKNFAVTVRGDADVEGDETFVVNLTSPTNATLLDPQGTGTILTDDVPAQLSINDITLNEGNSNQTSFTFDVSVTGNFSSAFTVVYATADGTATAPADYVAHPATTLTFNPGDTTKQITVLVTGDTDNEPNETFTVNLSGATGGVTISKPQGTGTITNDDGPQLSIADASLPEGDSGSANMQFTVTLSTPLNQEVVVQFASGFGTATAADLTATNGALTFAPNETTKFINVPITGDILDELDETFTVTLSDVTGATVSLSRAVATGTIVDDDPQPTLSVGGNITIAEGAGGNFVVNLSTASGRPVTVAFATAGGTATSGTDFTATSGILTFDPGQITKSIPVTTTTDASDEADETFTLTLSTPLGATIASGQDTATATITDDDAAPSLSINDVTVTEGNTGTVAATFTVTLSAASGFPVTVNFATSNGTATAPADYAALSGSLSFAPGELTKTITVQVAGDTLDEDNETFNVNLSGQTNSTIAKAIGVGTITDDDAPPVISISEASVTEGNTSTPTPATFTVTLSAASSKVVTVAFNTANGTAVAPGDYTSTSGTLTFAPGDTSETITVQVIGDTIDEVNETFLVNLSGAVNATIGVSETSSVGTINDDDGPPSISIADASVVEGSSGTTNLVFTATLSASSGQSVAFSFATANGTALAGNDYTATSGAITFAPGELTKTISVPITPDLFKESNETLFLNLSAATGGTLARTQITGTITDDDPNGQLESSDVTGQVFIDSNGNASQDPGERAIAGSPVQIRAADGVTVLFQTTTDANGFYLFQDVPPGQYVFAQLQSDDFLNGNSNLQPFTVGGGATTVTGPTFTEAGSSPSVISKRDVLASTDNTGTVTQSPSTASVQATDAAMASALDWMRRR